MKRCFSRYRLALFAIFFVSFSLLADQVWKGACGSGDIIDENLVIKGDTLLRLGATIIQAVNKDIKITLTKDATISGHWAGESQLYLMAAEGRKIRFEIDKNLTFIGSSSITNDNTLIIQSGPGTVEVAIAEGKSFQLTSQKDCSGGVDYYVLMYGGNDAPIDEYCCDEYASGGLCRYTDEYCGDEYEYPGIGVGECCPSRPMLNFIPFRKSSSQKDRRIVIGPKSSLSFLSSRKVQIAQDSGIVQFVPIMPGFGRMILEVQDTGAFITSGCYTCQRSGGHITSAEINRAMPAGYQAIWSTVNTIGDDVAAGLLVLDKNQTLSDYLVDPFLQFRASQDLVNYVGTFTAKRFGVIIGANGILDIQSNSYVDFVGLALNQIPNVVIPCFEACQTRTLIKSRNPSALIIDGNLNPAATNAQINFGEQAALFLRSGIADDGSIRGQDDVDPFTIEPSCRTRGAGNIVFDLEGQLDVIGTVVDGLVTSEIELLSLEVVPTGGSLFVGSDETNFPLRTFNTEDNELLQYNSGAFLINNRMNLYDTALSHTDEGHNVFQNNDIRSEPAYIGGETFKLLCSDRRPGIRFFNSVLNVNTDIALTGFDLVVPNFVDSESICRPNLVNFIFYYNGACVDNGTGRQMILGTRIGSTAADGCSRIDSDAHVDIIEQENSVGSAFDPFDPTNNQTLILSVAPNDSTIINNLGDTSKKSIQTLFLGSNSNISVGVNRDTVGFNIITNPWLRIAGNFFSFEAKGGARTVDRSNITGKGGAFVDLNGTISIDPEYIANFSIMVTKSHNGVVDLPAEQVFFNDGTGIATWNIDLSNPADQIIVDTGEFLSTYTFNWMLAKKDCINFSPYEIGNVNACSCPPVTEANVTSLPTIKGTIDDLQLQGTRIGDPAEILIDGGYVRKLSFINSQCSAEAPVAIIVLRDDGQVVLDSATTLGVNGVNIIMDGSGRVIINDDMIINNECAFIQGPNIAACDTLQLYSPIPHEIRLKSTGTLDLTSFTSPDYIIELMGDLRLVVEPGATIITGQGTLRFAGNSELVFEPSIKAFDFFSAIPFGTEDTTLPITTVDASLPHNPLSSLTNFGQELDNTDQFRVRIIGQGVIELVDNARASLPSDAFVGIETYVNGSCAVPLTDLTINIADNATFAIGHFNYNEGGVLQIGNVTNLGANHLVNFTLNLNGDNANFTIGSRGFFGLGAGIERFDGTIATPINPSRICDVAFAPNENIINTLSNVAQITFNLFNGRFEHDRIFSGDMANASLLAVANNAGMTFNLNFELPDENIDPALINSSSFNLAGGGNIVLIQPGIGGLQPIVLGTDGIVTARLSASIMASSLLQIDNLDVVGLTPPQFFDYIKTHDAVLEVTRDNAFGLANAASQGDSFRPQDENIRVGAIINGLIVRTPAYDIIGVGQEDSKNQAAIDSAAVFANIDSTLNDIITITNIFQ